MNARLPLVDPASLPDDERWLIPEGSHIFGTFVHSRAGLTRYRGMTTFISSENALSPRLREMALIQIGYVSNCAYEYTHHIKTGLRCGVSPEDILAIAAETAGSPTGLDAPMKAALRATRELTLGFDVSEDAFVSLQDELGNERLMDLLFSIVTYVGTVKLLLALRIELEDEYRVYLERFPLAQD